MSLIIFFKSHELLWLIFLFWKRKIIRNGDVVPIPKHGDGLFITGYARSGNTYFSNLIRLSLS